LCCFVFHFETGPHYVAQAGLELHGPASSSSSGITGEHHTHGPTPGTLPHPHGWQALPHLSFKLFADKFRKTAESFLVLWTLGRKDLVMRAHTLTELLQALCAGCCVLELVTSPPSGGNVMVRTSPWSTQVLATGQWQTLDWTHCSKLCAAKTDWLAIMWPLGRWKRSLTLQKLSRTWV
jgi:hypothetical protein